MISIILLALLIGIALTMLVWGLSNKDRFYQYPTLAGAAWLLYVVPQAIGTVSNPRKIPPAALEDNGMQIALLMCVLCAGLGFLGYVGGKRKPVSAVKSPTHYSSAKLFVAGTVLCLIGLSAAYLLAQLTGGFVAQFSVGGHYSLKWRGAPVRYAFFLKLIYAGTLLCLWSLLSRPTLLKGLMTAMFCIYPLALTVFLGRRTLTALLGMIFIITFFFVRRWAPPRWAFMTALVLFAVGVVLGSQYRTHSQLGADHSKLREIDIPRSVHRVVRGTEYAEFDFLIIGSAAFQRTKAFGLGTGFYNATVGQWVPRQIVGPEFKNALMIRLWPDAPTTKDLYGWSPPYGTFATGSLNAFSEFWFFGALIYFLMAMFYRHLWDMAFHQRNPAAQIWYVFLAWFIPISIIQSLVILPGQVLYLLVFLTPCLWFAQDTEASPHLVSSRVRREYESRAGDPRAAVRRGTRG